MFNSVKLRAYETKAIISAGHNNKVFSDNIFQKHFFFKIHCPNLFSIVLLCILCMA